MEKGSVVFSENRRYRYALLRWWDKRLPHVLWVMLNPSTADANTDDPTMHRVIGFSMDRLYGSLTVVNAFALISTDPLGLVAVDDPVGPENDSMLAQEVSQADTIICAWGSQRVGLHSRIREVRALIAEHRRAEARILCLGTNADHSPRHPVRLPTSTTLVPFEV
jgi:hypothetical protein